MYLSANDPLMFIAIVAPLTVVVLLIVGSQSGTRGEELPDDPASMRVNANYSPPEFLPIIRY
jgi:hypothetical protein